MVGKELEILCIGNALVDIFAQGKEGVSYGLNKSVQHVEIEKLNDILLNLRDYAVTSGGGAANVAKIAGFLGAKAAFTGAINSDRFGQLFEKDLLAAGVNLNLALKPSPTGICLMLKTGDKTTIAASPSAARELSESDILEEDIKKALIVLIDGFMLSRPSLVRYILGLADKHNVTTALDISSVSIAKEAAHEIADYAKRYSIFIFMNEEEAEAFYESIYYTKAKLFRQRRTARHQGKDISSKLSFILSDLNSSAGKKREITEDSGPLPGYPVIVVKLGERGALCFAGREKTHVKTEALIPRETTGAGDAFTAAFLTAWVRNKPLTECTALGNRAAGIVLNAIGTKINQPARKSLAQLFP